MANEVLVVPQQVRSIHENNASIQVLVDHSILFDQLTINSHSCMVYITLIDDCLPDANAL